VGHGKDYYTAEWTRLGYMSLSDNTESGFKVSIPVLSIITVYLLLV